MSQKELAVRLFGRHAANVSSSDDDDSNVDFVEDRIGDDSESDEEPVAAPPSKRQKNEEKEKEKPLWDDEDDANIRLDSKYLGNNLAPNRIIATDYRKQKYVDKFTEQLRSKFEQKSRLGAKPQWFQKIEEKETEEAEKLDSSDEEIMEAKDFMSKYSAKYLGKSKDLPPRYIKTTKVQDLTSAHGVENNAVFVVRFHPSHPVLLTAGCDSRIALYQVAKSETDLHPSRGDSFLQEVKFDKFSIDSVNFFDDATSVLVGSAHRNYFYTYELASGNVEKCKYPHVASIERNKGLRMRMSANGKLLGMIGNHGELFVFTAKTMEHIHTFFASDPLADAQFCESDFEKIYALTVNGKCHIWSLRAVGTQQTFSDEGSIHGTTLAVSKNEQFLACGSNTGIVNVYETASIGANTSPTPVYALTNLTTSADFVKFNHNNELLAFGSQDKPMGIRLLHMRSGTAYQNFPLKAEMLSKDRFNSVDFSPNSAFLAFPNKKGGVRMYRLNHYEKY